MCVVSCVVGYNSKWLLRVIVLFVHCDGAIGQDGFPKTDLLASHDLKLSLLI